MSGRAEVSLDLDAVIKILGLANKELLSDGGGFTPHYLSLIRDADARLHDVIAKSTPPASQCCKLGIDSTSRYHLADCVNAQSNDSRRIGK